MDAVKATALLRTVLFSMAFAIGAGFALMLIYARLDALQGSPPGGSPPGGNPPEGNPPGGSPPGGSPSGESVNIFHLPAQALALLVGIPAGLFLLACAAGLWERRLREKRRARQKKSLREPIRRVSAGRPSENSSRDSGSPPSGEGQS